MKTSSSFSHSYRKIILKVGRQLRGASIHRPLIVTLFCGYFFIWWGQSVLQFMYATIIKSDSWGNLRDFIAANPVATLLFLATIIGVIGYWYMGRWGVVIFGAASLSMMAVAFQQYPLTSFSLILSALVYYILNILMMIIGAYYWRRMG